MRDFQLPGRSTVHAARGMCATSHPIAAGVAVDVLKSGGSAADAAIACALVLNICEPQMTGLGGDLFALVKPAGSETVEALNASGRAAAGTDAGALRAAGHAAMPTEDAASVTVPGAVDGFLSLHERHGRLPLADVLAPAIHYAGEGVPVAPRAQFDWEAGAPRLQGTARDHFLIGGEVPRVGQIFRAPGQAEVLRRIASEGRAGFYEGEVAEDMIAALTALGGTHTADDFAATACDWGDPIRGAHGDVDLIEHPPNGQGATAILMSNILGQFDVAAMDPLGADRAHLEAEAAKLAYDARDRFVADRTERLDHMLAPETARALAALIDPKRAMSDPRTASQNVHKDTVLLTVVDSDRMAVSLIYSIFHNFGSGIATDRFGILFQNRGAGFTLEEGHPNEAGPGKRPMHTIIPAMLSRKGRISATFGVMGGAYQPAGHARLVSNLVDFGMDEQEAIDAPRSFPDAGVLNIERGYPETVRAALAERGHDVRIPPGPIGGAQMIALGEDGVLTGASDPRKDGCALGY